MTVSAGCTDHGDSICPPAGAIRTVSRRNPSVPTAPMLCLLCCRPGHQRSGTKARQDQSALFATISPGMMPCARFASSARSGRFPSGTSASGVTSCALRTRRSCATAKRSAMIRCSAATGRPQAAVSGRHTTAGAMPVRFAWARQIPGKQNRFRSITGACPCLRQGCWRRDRDSNPGTPQRVNGFRDRPVRPLRHLSATVVLLRGVYWRCRRVATPSDLPWDFSFICDQCPAHGGDGRRRRHG